MKTLKTMTLKFGAIAVKLFFVVLSIAIATTMHLEFGVTKRIR